MTAMTQMAAEAPRQRDNAVHRATPLGPSPFASTLPGILVAAGFGVASLVWLAVSTLPGGRWIVVHMFTLGVLTPLIWTFSQHFAVRLTASPSLALSPTTARRLTVVLAASILSMLVGRVIEAHVPLVAGTFGIMLVVSVNLRVFGRIEGRATTERFLWVVRQYRYAHVAFLVAASLGGALGAGWVPGVVYGAVRDAHIHLNILGWAGLTVLATLVPFGPALLRTRIAPTAERRAAAALPVATLGLGVATAGFVVAALGAGAAPARLLTIGGLAIYLYAVVVVALPLINASRMWNRSPLRWAVAASASWFVIAITVALARAVFGLRGWWQGLAVMLLVGVLAQLVVAVVTYVAPMLRGRDLAARDLLIARLEQLATMRVAAMNIGIGLIVAGHAVGASAVGVVGLVSQPGWLLVGATIALQLALLGWPIHAADTNQLYSATAARYRTAAHDAASTVTPR